MHVPVTTTAGEQAQFHVQISTPAEASAPRIDPARPTLVFLHGVYMAQQIFESQFNDPRLRQFNLVAIDRLGHGDSRGFVTEDTVPEKTAIDIKRVLDALEIASFHIVGVGIGTIVALELAVQFPAATRSVTLISPAPFEGPQEVNEGLEEIFEYWQEMGLSSDISFLDDIVFGAMQLVFHNAINHQSNAIRDITLQQTFRAWLGTVDNIQVARKVNLNFFRNRRVLGERELKQIRAPVQLIHGQDDIAYPLAHTRAVEAGLRAAGVAVAGVHEVRGPHYMLVLYPDDVNPRLRDLVLQTEGREDRAAPHKAPMETPWTEVLTERGFYSPDSDSSSEDGDIVVG
ncbi:Alpha/Beta hydrolase protein [Schizophyllum fasciatum]